MPPKSWAWVSILMNRNTRMTVLLGSWSRLQKKTTKQTRTTNLWCLGSQILNPITTPRRSDTIRIPPRKTLVLQKHLFVYTSEDSTAGPSQSEFYWKYHEVGGGAQPLWAALRAQRQQFNCELRQPVEYFVFINSPLKISYIATFSIPVDSIIIPRFYYLNLINRIRTLDELVHDNPTPQISSDRELPQRTTPDVES